MQEFEAGQLSHSLIIQCRILYRILNNIDVYEEPILRTKKVQYYAVEFEASEENRIVHESL